ncbi:hypothetical protein RchiOBHm_Chr1g0326561 [Rosa chinensis]|uniref:Transmembrane protein n=1 Tax=Rosa chinensis TaxID=74649 RepID=A0A2P6SA98_ROSCH|nr:hypothetical protein RchiOBHm_Chr1g0326561 [Rosa chinensis]
MKMWWLLGILGFLSFNFGLLRCNLAKLIMGFILFMLGLSASIAGPMCLLLLGPMCLLLLGSVVPLVF